MHLVGVAGSESFFEIAERRGYWTRGEFRLNHEDRFAALDNNEIDFAPIDVAKIS